MSVTVSEPIYMLDPSQNYRPDYKDVEEYRIYNNDQNDEMQKMIYETYRQMHTKQTVDFVRDRTAVWTQFNTIELPIMAALEKLNSFIDESDPDISLPNLVHAFQTAEGIRKAHPDLDWFHLTGLIHDLGKIMAIYGEPQWAVVGDTFAVGCAYGESNVYHELFDRNPDKTNPKYNTKHGIYSEKCGLDKVMMSWGHDEYMYRVLKNHKSCSLPEEALYMIRFHSFYPWHKGGDYYHLCSDKDLQMLDWIREFNKFDLYSKSPELPDIKTLIPYYQSLIDKYIPGLVKF
ncbi:unnamed protein product [Medioppia subpectinata]|uniref:Inositol oxygenase n=1 Tax=Medioppia subpectinata TaxID=1979941 RepID=A0A7R9KC84_9ACAR|nr:unnamed protein product [Medioppia subpectinata]CAG2100799.1 unnamed protein product [Medioppia subpectinata]